MEPLWERADAPGAGGQHGRALARGAALAPAGTSRPLARARLSPRLRDAVLAAHVIVSVGWLGVVAAALALASAAAVADDPSVARALYLGLAEILDILVMPPPASFSLAALLTGLVLSLGTKWRLFRHYWIVAKLALTVAVILSGILLVDAWVQQAVAGGPGAGSARTRLIVASASHALMLGAATVLSVYKPRGQFGRGPGAPGRARA